jgi:hypothetical protein
MIRHSFKETSAVSNEMYNFLNPETLKKSHLIDPLVQNDDIEYVSRKKSSARKFIPIKLY